MREIITKFKKYELLLNDFMKLLGTHPDEVILNCENQLLLKMAIRVATLSIDSNGRIHDHQRRVGKNSLNRFYRILRNKEKDIASCQSFDDIHSVVSINRIYKIGDLTVYDIAHRIGRYLKLYPDKIYLHSGTYYGAVKLLGRVNKPYLLKSELPEPICSCDLSCEELEDFLCICKSSL